jgi:uncharacterized protein YbbC (DUF1343 family)
MGKRKIILGLERFLAGPPELRGARIGLVCNQASVDGHFRHAADLFFNTDYVKLTALFGPQHGIRGEVQDNMIETPHTIDSLTGLPTYSLYSETRIPTAEMLQNVDVIVCDLQDVGCRIYTFIYTIANCMRAAKSLNKKVVVLDRPNPINGRDVEGGVLEADWASFVGQFPIPVRHGMTCGELALFFNKHFEVGCDLEVVTMDGWERGWLDESDAPWVMPSPNMPTPDTATVFPGTVLLEGTQLSEGRGTTRPFELVGAPYIDPHGFAEAINGYCLPGVYARACGFQPTFQKHARRNCGGVQLHVTDRDAFKPVLTGAAIVKTAHDMYPTEFRWKEPPYEYVYDKNPFDVIAGTDKLRHAFEQGEALSAIESSWQPELERFKALREEYLLY